MKTPLTANLRKPLPIPQGKPSPPKTGKRLKSMAGSDRTIRQTGPR